MSACSAASTELLPNAPPVCLLAGTSISSREKHLPWLVQSLAELCTAFRWVDTVLNLFDDSPQWPAAIESARHPRTRVTRVPGFKVLFWKREFHPGRYNRYTHIWLVDSDMAIAPSVFDLQLLLRAMHTVNASIVQPSPYGGGAGLYSLTANRGAHRQTHVCGDRGGDMRSIGSGRSYFDARCVACRVPVVEVKLPLFTRAAWDVVHSLVLAKIADHELTSDQGLDLVWCSLVEKHAGSGCTMKLVSEEYHKAKAANPGSPPCNGRPDQPSCTVPGCGATCAVVYATPVLHRDHRSIAAVMAGRSNATRSGGSIGSGGGANAIGGGKFVSNAIYGKVMGLHATHKMFPTWRPLTTLLRAEPCFSSTGPLRAALHLSNWSAVSSRAFRLQLAAKEAVEERLAKMRGNGTVMAVPAMPAAGRGRAGAAAPPAGRASQPSSHSQHRLQQPPASTRWRAPQQPSTFSTPLPSRLQHAQPSQHVQPPWQVAQQVAARLKRERSPHES